MSPLTESTRVVLAKGQPVPNDPSFAFTSLLLHGDGTNGSATITDSSSSPKTVTAFGNAQISTAQSKFGGSSISFDGNGDYIYSASNTGFVLGTGDFTVELFARFNAISDQCLYDTLALGADGQRPGGVAWVLQANGKLNFFHNGAFRLESTATLLANTWYHLVFYRLSGTFGYYVNGVSSGSGPLSIALTDSCFTCGVVANSLTSYSVNGHIDEYRITKGVARYTSNFTPPTAPFPDF